MKQKEIVIIMVRLKGRLVKTDAGIYDLLGPMGSQYKIVLDETDTLLVSITTGKVLSKVFEIYKTFEELVKPGKDILEIREPNLPVRYAVVRRFVDDKVDTTEGLVDPSYITAILDYNEWTDSFVRFKIF
jgi:hypothetical protein